MPRIVPGWWVALAVGFTWATVPAASRVWAQATDAPSPRPGSSSLIELGETLKALSARVRPAVVQIFTTRYAPELGTTSGGLELFARQRATGSGVLIASDGYIVTNAHVVADAERIEVLTAPSEATVTGTRSILKPRGDIQSARLVGLDEETDLALLQIEGSDFSHLEFGDSDRLAPGELVLAFGSPLGLETSLSMGVVSATARQLAPEQPMIYIQTDAAINPGNSGGPLVNVRGEIVGINTLIFSRSGGDEGLGFAAPSNIVAFVAERLRTDGRVRRGGIGATVQTVSPALAQGLGLPRATGVLVADVAPGSAADIGGLRSGDLILSLDGKPMENGRQFTVNLYQRGPGDEVALEIVRNQANRSLRIPVQERADDPMRFADLVKMEDNLVPRLGILVLDLSPELRKRLPPTRLEGGVLVASRTASARSGLEPGDVLYAVNRRPLASVAALRSEVAGLAPGSSPVIQLERAGKLQYLVVPVD